MNLQEHIKKVLSEPVNESTYFRRRVDMSTIDKKFFTNLNIVTDKYLKRHNGYCSFNVFRTTVISYLIDDYRDNLSDEDYDNFPYDEVYNFLLNLFYDKIKDRYVEVFGGDINESKQKGPRKLPNELKRRSQRLDDLIIKVIKDIELCQYNTPDEFIYVVVDELLWELKDDYHGDLNKLDKFDVTQYVYDFKYRELEDYYRENCE